MGRTLTHFPSNEIKMKTWRQEVGDEVIGASQQDVR